MSTPTERRRQISREANRRWRARVKSTGQCASCGRTTLRRMLDTFCDDVKRWQDDNKAGYDRLIEITCDFVADLEERERS